jgi:hypothetical protein
MNGSSISHGSRMNFYNFWIKGRRLKCSGYRVHTRAMYVYKLNNVRLEANRNYRNKRRNKLKAKIDELETQSKTKINNDVCQ